MSSKMEKLKRENEIMKRYFELIIDLGYDYDGYRNAKDLMVLVDELVELARDGKNANDKSTHFISSVGKQYNILMEEIKNV